MSMAVHHRAHLEAVDRLRKPRAAEEGIDFQRLVRDRVGNGGVVQHYHGALVLDRAHRILEPHRLVHGFRDEALDRDLTE